MSEAIGTLRDYQVVRWRKLAERRLEHVTELFVSGRWTRYFGENEFLEVIRNSKALVETWRKLAPPEPDARLPVSPFASQASDPVEDLVDRESLPARTEPGANEPDETAVFDPEGGASSIAPSEDFHFENALAMIALQRLRETANEPVSDIEQSVAA